MHLPVVTDESPTEQNVVKSDSQNPDQIFEEIGKQVQHLALDETAVPAGFEGRAVVVDAIESLCMECGEDVS